MTVGRLTFNVRSCDLVIIFILKSCDLIRSVRDHVDFSDHVIHLIQAATAETRSMPPQTGSMRHSGSLGHHSDDIVTRMKNIDMVELGR